MGTSLREEMISLSLFGGRLALAELILFSVFLTDILLLGLMGEINLSGVLLANAAFVLCYVTALGFLQGALPLASQRFEVGDRGGYHAIVAMSLLLGGGMAVLVLLIFLGPRLSSQTQTALTSLGRLSQKLTMPGLGWFSGAVQTAYGDRPKPRAGTRLRSSRTF